MKRLGLGLGLGLKYAGQYRRRENDIMTSVAELLNYLQGDIKPNC